MVEGPPPQGTDPSCVPEGVHMVELVVVVLYQRGNWGHFPDGIFPVPQSPPPFPLLCQADLQDSWLTMEIAAMKEQSRTCQGSKVLGTDFWSSSSLVSQTLTL